MWTTMSRVDGGMHPRQSYAFEVCTSGNTMLYPGLRSSEREMQTNELLGDPRQGYGLFAAKLCFKPHLRRPALLAEELVTLALILVDLLQRLLIEPSYLRRQFLVTAPALSIHRA